MFKFEGIVRSTRHGFVSVHIPDPQVEWLTWFVDNNEPTAAEFITAQVNLFDGVILD
jgi:hypothetical protein